MASKNLPRPTDAELEILNVLWRRGPSTVREVYEVLLESREIGYTTVLKFMQIMSEKGLVSRDQSDRTHVYQAERAQDETQRQLLSDLLDRAFNGSPTKLVMQALSSKKASREELAEIRRMLDELEGGKK
ncbi:MAG TPA: BlaI/MecI/CopY family transcriptional regulator [Pyrinomonadaceae bacterium]|jgi:predicted transcriptional regulator